MALGRDNNLGFHEYCDYDSRTALEALACVKYYYTRNTAKIPFGFESTGIKNIYKNNYYLPFGYTYDSFILMSDFEKYSELEKQQILMQSMVLDNAAPFSEKKQFSFENKKVPYTIESGDGIEVEEGQFVVKKENASLTLIFTGLRDSETYLYFNNLNFNGKGKLFFYQYDYYRTPLSLSYKGEKNRKFTYCQPKDDYYVDIHNFVFNLGYSKDPKAEVTLTFEKKGTYSFDELAVVCQTFNQFPVQIDSLRRDAWTDVHFDTNRVSGTVDFSADKLMLISIPYADGWKAVVDGKQTPLLRGNIMNMALPMEKGHHTIELVYSTPFLKMGFCISIATIILFTAFMLIKRRREGSKAA